MPLLHLKRTYHGDKYTIGHLSVDGRYFCDTLELPEKYEDGVNVPCHTCIPAGDYTVLLSWSPAFQRRLPRLFGISGRDGILIHRGNTPSDTSGCILLGENKVTGQLINSTEKETSLVELLSEEQACIITIE